MVTDADDVATVPVVFDSDGGIDDAAALWWACLSPAVEVVAVTAVGGNVGVGQAGANLAAVLAAAGHGHVPVALGAPGPLGRAPLTDRPVGIHGSDGLGDTAVERPAFHPAPEPAAELLRRLVAERPGELSVVSSGPFTNLAQVLRTEPDWAGRVRSLTAMAGSARAGGNAGPWSEANVAHDPDAAREVMAATWLTPPTMVGLDVTHQATLTDDEFALLAEHRTPAAAFLHEPLVYYRPQGSRFTGPNACPCHDLLAMMAVSDPDVIGGPLLPVQVDVGESAAWGATVVDFRYPAMSEGGGGPAVTPPLWRIALEVDVAGFRRRVRRMFGD